MVVQKFKFPDILEKRDLLYGATGDEVDFSAYGDAFFEKGYYHDAFLFYEKAGDKKGFEKLLDVSVSSGNLNVLARLTRIDGFSLTGESWAQAAQNALNHGKLRYAAEIYERAGNPDMAAKILQDISAEAESDLDSEEKTFEAKHQDEQHHAQE